MYLGNTPTQQAFTPAVDVFSGNGSTTAFTLSRPVASVAQVQAFIENVPQSPVDAFTVSGNTITFTSAPPSGSSNIYVRYTSPITQVITPTDGTVGTSQLAAGAVTSAKMAAGAARANFGAGAVLQVVQGTYATQVLNATNTFADTGLSASITPTSASSKILILASSVFYAYRASSQAGGKLQLVRNSTNLYTQSDSSFYITTGAANTELISNAFVQYYDSPATTSSTTYKLQFAANVSSNVYINWNNNPSYITLLEIAA